MAPLLPKHSIDLSLGWKLITVKCKINGFALNGIFSPPFIDVFNETLKGINLVHGDIKSGMIHCVLPVVDDVTD